MHLTHNESIKTLEDVVLRPARQVLMSTWLALDHMMENGSSVNFMVGTNKRVKQILKKRKSKSSTN